MSVQITLVPVWSQQSQQLATTRIRIQIELSEVEAMLDSYDLLVETEVIVKEMCYPNTVIVTTPEQKQIDFTITVLGNIVSTKQVHVRSTGYWMQKEEKEGG